MLRNLAVFGMALALVGPVWGQAAKTAPARSAAPEAPTRVAVINIQSAIASTAEGKDTAQKLTAEYAPRRTELTNLSKQIQDIQQRVQDGQNTLSQAEQSRLQFEYQRLSRQLSRKQQEYQQDSQDASTDAIDSIGQKMIPIIARYANEKGYSVVLDTSAQASPVLFASNTVDITNDIVKLYDQAYPVKKAAAPAAKSTPK